MTKTLKISVIAALILGAVPALAGPAATPNAPGGAAQVAEPVGTAGGTGTASSSGFVSQLLQSYGR